MKSSYKFIWREGDQYAYRWRAAMTMTTPTQTQAIIERVAEWETAPQAIIEMVAETETYCHIWSSRKVSQQIKTNKKEKQ